MKCVEFGLGIPGSGHCYHPAHYRLHCCRCGELKAKADNPVAAAPPGGYPGYPAGTKGRPYEYWCSDGSDAP